MNKARCFGRVRLNFVESAPGVGAAFDWPGCGESSRSATKTTDIHMVRLRAANAGDAR